MKRFILGSRSPRRLELLGYLVPNDRIVVMPPTSSEEAGFTGLKKMASIEQRLSEIAGHKYTDVCQQVERDSLSQVESSELPPIIIAADTVIVGIGDDGQPTVLGQPPANDNWQDVVRAWFIDYLLPRPHWALTALWVGHSEGQFETEIVRTQVSFHSDMQKEVEWYLQTGESRGKAGGYAIQGAGSLFVEEVSGSISNVIGLPLYELTQLFQRLKVDVLTR